MDRRRVNSRIADGPGDVQEPIVSSTVDIPYPTITQPRISNIRNDCIGLFYPLPVTSTYLLFNYNFFFQSLIPPKNYPYPIHILKLFSTLLQHYKHFLLLFTDYQPTTTTTTASKITTSKSLFLVLIIFVSSLMTLALVYNQFPDLEE